MITDDDNRDDDYDDDDDADEDVENRSNLCTFTTIVIPTFWCFSASSIWSPSSSRHLELVLIPSRLPAVFTMDPIFKPFVAGAINKNSTFLILIDRSIIIFFR